MLLKNNGQTVVSRSVSFAYAGRSVGQEVVYSNAGDQLTNLPTGTYDIYINGPVHLTRKFTRVINAGSQTADVTATKLLAGDSIDTRTDLSAAPADKIDIFDYNDLVTYFACKVAPASPPPGKTCSSFASDFDFDGDIDIFDYNFLVGNFNKSGEL